jgi:hypothetical protein
VSKGDSRRLKAGDVLLFGARPCACEGRAAPQNRQYEETIAGNRSRPFSHFALVLLTIISGVTTAAHLDLARADDCLMAPNSPAPKGSHWYYHLNRATQQKCWYVRSVESQPQDVTVQTSPPNAAKPPTNVGQIRPTGPRDNDSSARQPEPVVAATDEPASGNVPTMKVAAAGPETPLSTADPRPTAPATPIWPDPPPISPSVQADNAEAATASPDPAYSDASDSVSRMDERTSKSGIPIGLFPALALGLVVFGFGLRFLMRHAAARRAQEIVTTPTHDYAKPSGDGLKDGPTNSGEDVFQKFVSAVGGSGTLERIVHSVHSPNHVGPREARLARLREDICQCLGWAKPELQHSSRQKA